MYDRLFAPWTNSSVPPLMVPCTVETASSGCVAPSVEWTNVESGKGNGCLRWSTPTRWCRARPLGSFSHAVFTNPVRRQRYLRIPHTEFRKRVFELTSLEESGFMRGTTTFSHTAQRATPRPESFDRCLDGLIAFPATLFDATGAQATASSLCCACPPRFCSCNILLARLIVPANMARHAIPERPTHRLTCMSGLRIQAATNDTWVYLAGSRLARAVLILSC
jgi:hypothetical protein